jgi:hypothetical protein
VNLADSINTNADTVIVKTFTLRDAGISEINKTGTTQFAMLSSRDIDSSEVLVSSEYTTFYNDTQTYLSITYTSVINTPTNFRLTGATDSSVVATFTPNHSSGVDSVTIVDDSGTWIAKLSTVSDSTMTVTGLTQGTQYIFRARVDSGGVYVSSNLDTVTTSYAIANPPTWAFTENYDDSTKITIGNLAGSNHASVTYAIRDSTNQKWIDTDGSATTSAVWQTAAQWLTTENITGQSATVKHKIGVKAKNGDDVETAYTWGNLTIGNVRWSEIAALNAYTHRSIRSAAYVTARNDTAGTTTAAIDTLGQWGVGASHRLHRASLEFIIPEMDDAISDSLQLTGEADGTATDFRIYGAKGLGRYYDYFLSKWVDWTPTNTRVYRWSGWAISGAYTADNIFTDWSTSSYAATMKIPGTEASLTDVYAARSDTVRWFVTTAADSALADTTVVSWITVSAPKLLLRYVLSDKTPSAVVVSAIAKDSVLVTWLDGTINESGFALVNAYTGARMGGSDSTAAGATSKRYGGLDPNKVYNIAVKVLGGKLDGEISTAQDSARTWAAKPTIASAMVTNNTREVTVDTTGTKNPSTTLYAVRDSIRYAAGLSAYIFYLAGTCSLGVSPAWYTFAQMGTSGKDTVTYPAGMTSAFQVLSKNTQ